MSEPSQRVAAPAVGDVRPHVTQLAAQLISEMTRRWRAGERPLPEEFLSRHPELWEQPEAAADLIYEELCLREEYGPDVSVEQVLDRFPQWRPQLELLFDCQRLLGPRRPAARFPAAGESLGDFLLLAELGRGVNGRVFLASQLSLGERPVVLKLAPTGAAVTAVAEEHLSLARLQHTNIVPLYSVQELPARGLRALVMPYFGGATLARLLGALRPTPPANRMGQDLLDTLEANGVQCSAFGVRRSQSNSERRAPNAHIAGATYAQSICWIGACLADALQYAHDRGLVHLDLKPSNVLLTADGQPMVLDFHLAREPISPTDSGPTWLGGTQGFMSPEQSAALIAVRHGKSVAQSVDARSDVFSLGVVLYEALAGGLPWSGVHFESMTTVRESALAATESPETKSCVPLHVRNAQVSIGLSDIIHKCLAEDPAQRYPTMAALAADLRRHLADLPLAGIRNRSLAERWHKWRRRRPHGVALTGMMGAVLSATCAVAVGAATHVSDRIDQARIALTEGQVEAARGEWDLAAGTLRRGLAAVESLPWQGELTGELHQRLTQAEGGRVAAERLAAAAELHRLADRTRFLYGADRLPSAGLPELAAGCRVFWGERQRIVAKLGPALDPAVRADLYDVAICWADLAATIHPSPTAADSLAIVGEAEDLFGPSPVLEQERRRHGAPTSAATLTPQTAWEHYAAGRALLRLGELDAAATEIDRAVQLDPQALWPNFYQGVCSYRRGNFIEAVTAFGVAMGAAPNAAGCFYNRALAFAALGRPELAVRDYDQALRLDPSLTSPALDRLRVGKAH
jgi:eukaryotic-like serine/threonine-protein kinase